MSLTIAIVDPFSSGDLLAQAMVDAGHRIIDVQSSRSIPACFRASYHPRRYIASLTHHGGLDLTLARLRELRPDLVLAGAETGVELADWLSERLGLLTNGTRRSQARRDKYLMVEALRAKGVATVRHHRTGSLPDLLAWIDRVGGYPAVVKPVKSAGADSVAVCRTVPEVEAAFRRIVGRTNQLGLTNHEVIGQSFLEGCEYIVNSVSRDGLHRICDIWRCRKELLPGAGFVSCLEELVPPESDAARALIPYAREVLGALAIQHGPVHQEIMLTAIGPVLIEAGARLQGAIHPPSIRAATGTSQVNLTVEAYTHPAAFLAKAGVAYRMQRGMYHAFLLSPVEGTLRGLPGRSRLLALPSCFHLVPKVKIGEPIRRTVNLFSAAGVIDLVHERAEVLEADYRELRRLEREELYHV